MRAARDFFKQLYVGLDNAVDDILGVLLRIFRSDEVPGDADRLILENIAIPVKVQQIRDSVTGQWLVACRMAAWNSAAAALPSVVQVLPPTTSSAMLTKSEHQPLSVNGAVSLPHLMDTADSIDWNALTGKYRARLGIDDHFLQQPDALHAFVRLHRLAYQLSRASAYCRHVHAMAGTGGNALVYGVARPMVTELVQTSTLLVQDAQKMLECVVAAAKSVRRKFSAPLLV